MKVTYYINGVSFDTLGVRVSASRGILSALKLKDPVKVAWPDQHGEAMDLSKPRYDSREITLDCYIAAATPTAFILAVQAFIAAFQKTGLQQLQIDVNDGVVTRKPLLYYVYMHGNIDITKRWNSAKQIGTFSLQLREPEPIKRVYSFAAVTGAMDLAFTLTTTDPVNIYWGDGSVITDVVTASGEVEHTYTTEGTFYIVITGVIDSISAVTTTATLVWTKL